MDEKIIIQVGYQSININTKNVKDKEKNNNLSFKIFKPYN